MTNTILEGIVNCARVPSGNRRSLKRCGTVVAGHIGVDESAIKVTKSLGLIGSTAAVQPESIKQAIQVIAQKNRNSNCLRNIRSSPFFVPIPQSAKNPTTLSWSTVEFRQDPKCRF